MMEPMTPSSHAASVPRARTTFIGRARELAQVGDAIASGQRLVTLAGAGGSGKTRLAIELASALRAQDRDVAFVDLVPIADRSGVVDAIVDAARGDKEPREHERSSDPLEALIGWLADRPVVLVLDNCEHVIDAVAGVAHALVDRCAGMQILATSREPLGVDGEVVLPLHPLPAPDVREMPDPATVMRYDSVRLYLDRARAVDPQFEPSGAEVSLIARICKRLDGLPLAIELAAARAGTMSLSDIHDRLADRFRLLATTRRTVQSRHQTLRATLDWSYELLSDQERTLFERLGVFPGSFDLPTVESVCAGDGIDRDSVFDLLARLVERSMVVFDPSADATRYYLLETLRHYAAERLARSSSFRRVNDALARHAASVVHEFAHERVDADVIYGQRYNIRAAVAWDLRDGDATRAARLLFEGYRLWWTVFEAQGPFAEAEAVLAIPDMPRGLRAGVAANASAFLAYVLQVEDSARYARLAEAEIDAVTDPMDLAMIGVRLGWAAWFRGVSGRPADVDEAEGWFSRAREHARTAGAVAWEIESVAGRGWVAWQRGDREAAVALHEEALAIARRGNDKVGIANTLIRLSNVYGSDTSRAVAAIEEAIGLLHELGDASTEASAHRALARRRREQGDVAAALRHIERSVELGESVGFVTSSLWALREKAEILRVVGDVAGAEEALRRALEQADELNERAEAIDTCIDMARIALQDGRFADAAAQVIEALARAQRHGWSYGVAHVAELAAELLERRGLEQDALVLFAYARRVTGGKAGSGVDRIRDAVDGADDAVARGEALSPDQAASAIRSACAVMRNENSPIAAGAMPSLGSAARARFAPEGDVYAIAFDGREARVRASKGMRYVHLLLGSPSREWHVADLSAAVEGLAGAERVLRADSAHAGTMLDDEAARVYRARIEELDEQIAEAESWQDLGRAQRAREERDALARQLAAAFGLGGRPRTMDDPNERMRKAVWNRIRDAISRIERVHPSLGQHLRNAVATGTYCRYSPDRRIEWET